MSAGRHPAVTGNLTALVPLLGYAAGMARWDPKDDADYGGTYEALATPVVDCLWDDDLGLGPAPLHLPSPGLDLHLTGYYHSHLYTSGALGYGRILSAELTLQASLDLLTTVTLTRGNGDTAQYRDSGCGCYEPITPGLLNTLRQDVANHHWLEETPDGRVTAYPLDITGAAVSALWVQDAVGNLHSFSYNGDGMLASVTDTVGRQVTFDYNGDGVVARITDWAGREITFTYDGGTLAGRQLLETVTDATGQVTTYGYDSQGRLTSITDPAGDLTEYQYDSEDRAIQRTVTCWDERP